MRGMLRGVGNYFFPPNGWPCDGTVDAAVALRSGEEQKMHRQVVISERLSRQRRSELGVADVTDDNRSLREHDSHVARRCTP